MIDEPDAVKPGSDQPQPTEPDPTEPGPAAPAAVAAKSAEPPTPQPEAPVASPPPPLADTDDPELAGATMAVPVTAVSDLMNPPTRHNSPAAAQKKLEVKPPSKRRRVLRRVYTVLIFATLVVMGVTLLTFLTRLTFGPLLYLVVAIPYLVVVAVLVAIVGLFTRRRWWAVGLLALTLVWVPILADHYRADPAPMGGKTLTIMTFNMEFGNANAEQITAAVREHNVDVLLLQEVTESAQLALTATKLWQVLSYTYAVPKPNALGSAMWSRYPLSDTTLLGEFYMTNQRATMTVSKNHKITLVNAHPAFPLSYGKWKSEHKQFREAVQGIEGPVLLAGDFNATSELPPMRRLGKDGYGDVALTTGAGMQFSWGPSTGGQPLFAIDHVLTRGSLTGLSQQVIRIDGSDHRAVIAQVMLDPK